MKMPHVTVNPLAAAGAAAPLGERLLWKTLIFQNKNSLICRRLSRVLVPAASRPLTPAEGRSAAANYSPGVTGGNSAFYIRLGLKLLKRAHEL